MQGSVIRNFHEITVEWLNDVLQKYGAIESGEVCKVEVLPLKSDNSSTYRLVLEYSEHSIGEKPKSLFLKLCTSNEQFISSSEVFYYNHDYITLANAPILTCYDASYDEETHSYHILLEDVSITHVPSWKYKPSLEYGKAIVEAMAKLHAHHWVTNNLSKRIAASIPGEEQINRYLAEIRPGLKNLLDACKNDIPPHWVNALYHLFEKHPIKMLERTNHEEGFTLIHGDLNPGNILIHQKDMTPLYLIDRQPFVWQFPYWLGVSDVTYAIVHWWDSKSRKEWEFPILEHYHETLVNEGVNGYSWEQLLYDYKLCSVQSVYVVTNWCVDVKELEKMRWVWFPQLQKAMTAIFDLNCLEILV
jgi:serine/threonine protein kinase